jgi:predicted aldo/keto reductase-like oxidoreductase
MPNMTILQANVAAALNMQPLSEGDKRRLDHYARQTAPGYCAGCAHICETAVNHDIPISDILRYCMYDHGYNDRAMASELFKALPADTKAKIIKTDYSKAETYCPQRMPIGKLLKKAHGELA